MYRESMNYGPMKDVFALLQKASIDIPPAGMSLFVFSLGLFYFFAYAHEKRETAGQENTYLIYYTTAPLLLFFLFTRYESYRPFYLIPLLYLLMMLRPEYTRINLILETVFTAALMCFYLLDDILFYNPNYLLTVPGREICPAETVSAFLTKRIPGFGFQSFTALSVLAGILFLVLNHPSLPSKNEPLNKKEEPWLLTVRSILYAVPGLLAFFLRFIHH